MLNNRRERVAHRAFLNYCESGDPDAIARVFDAAAPKLHALAIRLSGDAATADDLVQATFLDAIFKSDRFDPDRPLLPWLTGILANHARHERRSRLRRPTPVDDLPPNVDAREGPADEVVAREFADALATALARLPTIYREVVQLRLQQGLTPAEIADQLRRPAETVKTQLKRGMHRLKRALPASSHFALAPLLQLEGVIASGARGGIEAVRESVCGAAREWGSAGRAPSIDHGFPHGVETATRARRSSHGLLGAAAVLAAGAFFLVDFETSSAPSADPARDPSRVLASGVVRSAATTVEPVVDRVIALSDAERLGAAGRVTVSWLRDGSPADGITVSLQPATDGSWLRELRSRTDARGVARFRRDDLAQHALWTVRTCRGVTAGVQTVAQLVDGVQVGLPTEITVTGTVMGPDNEAVPGARLWLAPAGARTDEGSDVATSDVDGAYTIHGVKPGSTLGALATSHAPAPMIRVLAANGSDCRFDFQLGEAVAPIEGVVIGPTGRPVVGAAVLVGWSIDCHDVAIFGGEFGLGAPTRLRTDVRGMFRLHDQRRDAVPIWVGTPDFAVAHQVLEPTADRLRIRLEPGVQVVGTVESISSGRRVPLAGASIEIVQSELERPRDRKRGPSWTRIDSRSDQRGEFRTRPVLVGGARMIVQTGNGEHALRHGMVTAGTKFEWNITLVPKVDSSGVLVGPDATPLSDWQMEILDATAVDSVIRATTTDERGRFNFAGLESGQDYTLRIRDRRTADRDTQVIRTLLASADRTPVRIELEPHEVFDSTVRIEVREPRGAATGSLIGIFRRLEADGGVASFNVRGRWVSGESGPETAGASVEFANLRGGRYELWVLNSARQHAQVGILDLPHRSSVDAGVVAFRPPAVLRVRALAPDGAPLSGVSFRIHPAHSTIRFGVRIDAGVGTCELQPGRHALVYLGVAGAPVLRTLDLASGTNDVEVRLAAADQRWFRYRAIPRDYSLRSIDWLDSSGKLIYSETSRLHVHHNAPFRVALPDGDYQVVVRDWLDGSVTTKFTLGAGRRGARCDDPVAITIAGPSEPVRSQPR